MDGDGGRPCRRYHLATCVVELRNRLFDSQKQRQSQWSIARHMSIAAKEKKKCISISGHIEKVRHCIRLQLNLHCYLHQGPTKTL